MCALPLLSTSLTPLKALLEEGGATPNHELTPFRWTPAHPHPLALVATTCRYVLNHPEPGCGVHGRVLMTICSHFSCHFVRKKCTCFVVAIMRHVLLTCDIHKSPYLCCYLVYSPQINCYLTTYGQSTRWRHWFNTIVASSRVGMGFGHFSACCLLSKVIALFMRDI